MKKFVYTKSENQIYKLENNAAKLKKNPEFAIYYINVNKPDFGFKADEVERFPNAYLFADTLTELETLVKTHEHEQKYGAKVKTYFDTKCPKCGYHYTLDYYDNNDGYYTPAIKEDFSDTIKCICGCKFEAEIKVTVKFKTKILNP